MNRKPFSRRLRAVLAVLAAGLLPAAAVAQVPAVTTPIARGAEPEAVPAYAQAVINGTDQGVVQAGCASCGRMDPLPAVTGAFSGGDGGCMCSDGCESCNCKPGRKNCGSGGCGSCGDGCAGRFFGGLHECLCCPDPCYEPLWVHTANAAFFQDTVRPKTYTRFRYDYGDNLTQPDRAEYFWARIGRRGPPKNETGVNYDELSLYQEVATGGFGFFIEEPYRSVYPDVNDHHANFGDLNLGTKSLLLDCELLQLTFQFKTYVPTGNSRTGIGTGHTALEPSLLASLKLSQSTYLQMQVAEWIPIGGDQDFEGSIIHYHASLNHSWCKRGPFELISTAEINGWTFQDGAFTDPAGKMTKASGETYVTTGGGLRIVYCEKYDLGFGAAFSLTDDHFADQLYRTEFRIRY